MSIKYYQLAKDEKLPDEFCVVRDVNGEPSEYTWYERMSDFERELLALFTQSDWFAGSEYRKLQAENAKLRELVQDMWRFTGTACKKYPRLFDPSAQGGQMVQPNAIDAFEQRMRELGVEVDG